MERQLPPGLSGAQRSALLEFFAGHISAGQLTGRLGIDACTRAQGVGTRPTGDTAAIRAVAGSRSRMF